MSNYTNAATARSGWYKDPSGEHELRFFDGVDWTARVRDGDTEANAPLRPLIPHTDRRFQYKVEQVRESLVGDKIKTGALERLLEQYAATGWQVRTITSASVAGRLGPGGTTGLIVVFERPLSRS